MSALFKSDVIDAIAKKTGGSKTSIDATISALSDVVIESLKKGNDVSLIGFVNFKVVDTKARKARNPKTGKEISIKAGKKVKVVLGKSVKESVKK
ncbi:MAG: HU family DNA-binding protein [Rickettsiales bacterium]|jgi:DNA-binding protein HU-beta|nr:HU family DNA-binding protein [Rickettsiales bacterium]